MVAAAPLEELEDAEVDVATEALPEELVPEEVEVGAELAEELLEEAAATNLSGSSWPQFAFSSAVHLS